MLYHVTDAANLSVVSWLRHNSRNPCLRCGPVLAVCSQRRSCVQVLTDGPYGGGVCGATNHSHHRNAQDSVYQQYRLQAQFYRKLFSQGCAPTLPVPQLNPTQSEPPSI